MDFDTRQIQTAVQGGPESDEPLVCPTDPVELDTFRLEYTDKSFWCGVLLGGCGGQLTTRRCATRVCHFAHVPDPNGVRPQCGQRARGVSSADHLYVKTATQAWLHRQGHTPRYHFIDRDDVPIGSVVDIELDGRRLRVHMNSQVPPDWDEQDAGEVILGPGVRIPAVRLEQLRYVNRVKFETDGHRRLLVLGTEVFGKGTVWGFALADCEITEDGRLKTPVVEQIWNTKGHEPAPAPAPVPAAVPLTQPPASPDTGQGAAAVQIGELVRNISTAIRRNDVAGAQRLCEEGDQEMSRCEGAALYHLANAVRGARTWLAGHERERRVLFARLEQAVSSGNGTAARTLLNESTKLATHGEPSTDRESKTLAAAWKLAAIPAQKRVRPAPVRPRPLMVDNQAREQRRTRRLAHAKARSLIGRLRAKGLPAEERHTLLAELAPVAEAAGDWLSTRDRRDVQKWLEPTEKESSVPDQPKARAESGRPDSPTKVMVSAAAAVRGALKKAAREQRTTTRSSWSSSLVQPCPA